MYIVIYLVMFLQFSIYHFANVYYNIQKHDYIENGDIGVYSKWDGYITMYIAHFLVYCAILRLNSMADVKCVIFWYIYESYPVCNEACEV